MTKFEPEIFISIKQNLSIDLWNWIRWGIMSQSRTSFEGHMRLMFLTYDKVLWSVEKAQSYNSILNLNLFIKRLFRNPQQSQVQSKIQKISSDRLKDIEKWIWCSNRRKVGRISFVSSSFTEIHKDFVQY